jgi:hypothetical protein
LKLGYVIAPQHRTGEIQQPLAELPTGFSQAFEGEFVNDPGEGESARALKRLHQGRGLVVKDVCVIGRSKRDRAEALFELANPRAGVAAAKWLETQVNLQVRGDFLE